MTTQRHTVQPAMNVTRNGVYKTTTLLAARHHWQCGNYHHINSIMHWLLYIAHMLTILLVGAQASSPELLSEISFLQSSQFSKHFAPVTSFSDVFFPFRWLSMLSIHLSLGLPLGLFPFLFNFITTLSIESSSLLMTWPNHRSLFL